SRLGGFEKLIQVFRRCGQEYRCAYYLRGQRDDLAAEIKPTLTSRSAVRDSGRKPWRCQQRVQKFFPLSQGTLQQQFSGSVKDIEDQIGDWDLLDQSFAGLFAAQALLQGAEGESPLGTAVAPGHDFAVEDRILRQTGEGRG